ncbi:hypothetical protein H4R18_002676 [Coemansia javaensis]|uniref:Wings apart-like protein C-terminal domain-containing protein n=1 Tax=Coemansia javaensis TaxID=2761396 RepID=A0A9W8HE05_9FUNG|nr:hypothetical protein H4R18_002676 [Coemansia javaensis]
MADPFAAIRRKPAGATYGRRALAARRLAGSEGPSPSRAVAASSSGSSSDSDAGTPQQRRLVAGGQAKRAAVSAMAGLDSAHAVLEATRHSWDLGGPGEPAPARQVRRPAKSGAGATACVGAQRRCPPADNRAAVAQRARPAAAAPAPTPPDATARAPKRSPATDAGGTSQSLPVGLCGAAARPKPARARRTQRPVAATRSGRSSPAGPGSADPESKRLCASQPAPADSDAWDMVDLISSSPIAGRVATFGGGGRRARQRKRDDLPSSSPPSTPGRLVGGSRLPSSAAGSGDESDRARGPGAARAATPPARVAGAPDAESPIGPSAATSRRLQSRAFGQHVVYKYGRTRAGEDDGDDDELALGLARILGAAGPGEAISRPLLACAGEARDGAPDTPTRPGGGRVLQLGGGPADDPPPDQFKRRLGDVVQALGVGGDGHMGAACLQLLEQLGDGRFREELLASRHGLPALLGAMQRARQDALVQSTAMLVIAAAFGRVALVQTLVFERHALETVAEILKAAAAHDVLALRDRGGFATADHRRCAARICALARGLRLVGDSLPISTYSLALSALHAFTRKDDAALLAMAPLLRAEMHESGCLGLVAARSVDSSIPRLARPHGSAAQAASADATSGDAWMEFDLPEERRHVPAAPATASASRSRSDRTRAPPPGSQDKDALAALLREPSSSDPTPALVALELEILQFCATASPESQAEILSLDACVSAPLALLAASQQQAARSPVPAPPPVAALELVVLVLELFVNLSNSSTAFCSRFIACNGLDVVAKNIAVASQALAAGPRAPGAGFSPRRKALADAAGDLRYDILLTTSALLTNIVDSDPSSAVHIAQVRQSQRCRLGPRCFPHCRCADRAPLAALVAGAFAACHAAQSSADASVAAGYLAVLLGFLMRSPEGPCRELIMEHLPGRDPAAVVVEHIERFICVSDAASRRFASLTGGGRLAGGLQHSHNHSQKQGSIAPTATTSALIQMPGAAAKPPASSATLQAIVDMLTHSSTSASAAPRKRGTKDH